LLRIERREGREERRKKRGERGEEKEERRKRRGERSEFPDRRRFFLFNENRSSPHYLPTTNTSQQTPHNKHLTFTNSQNTYACKPE